MTMTERHRTSNLFLEVLVAIGVQLGLSRALAKACDYAEVHELPARVRGGVRLGRHHRAAS